MGGPAAHGLHEGRGLAGNWRRCGSCCGTAGHPGSPISVGLAAGNMTDKASSKNEARIDGVGENDASALSPKSGDVCQAVCRWRWGLVSPSYQRFTTACGGSGGPKKRLLWRSYCGQKELLPILAVSWDAILLVGRCVGYKANEG